MPTTPAHARCLNCNYPLHSLPTNTCPECGKEFNPADPATMNLGKIPGLIARRLLRRTGWPTLLLALAATVTLFITSGPPRMVAPKLADTAYLLNLSQRSDRLNTRLDVFYAGAIIIWIVVLMFLAFRIVARLTAQRIYSRRNLAPRRHALRQVFLLLALLFSMVIVLYAWPMRVTRVWMAVKPPKMPYGLAIRLYPRNLRGYPQTSPFQLSESEKLAALRLSTQSNFQTHRDRIRTIQFFIAQYPAQAVEFLRSLISIDSDPEIRALAIHVVSLTHKPENAAQFEKLLNDPAPAVRAAAADAIDILRGPGITQPDELWTAAAPEVMSDPPINVAALVPIVKYSSHPLPPVIFDAPTHERLEQLMVSGDTTDEREAAARALVNWPPANYKLRVAEWGVWIVDGKGNVDIVQKVIDEIPPFVHRIGNTHDSLDERFPQWTGDVTKPIVHVTADRPLALDVEAYIYSGRPWFVYPMPDDLALSQRRHFPNDSARDQFTVKFRKQLDNPSIPPLADLREGYPWLGPPHRYHFRDPRFGGVYPNFMSLGVRWQSLIVLPKQAAWMKPPAVPSDPKFKWWSDLRNVPSSYLANRGESERFLYYDGPTQSKPPVVVTLKDSQLHLSAPPHRAQAPEAPRVLPDEATPLQQDHTPLRDAREAFFIRINGGKISAMRFTLSETGQSTTQNLPATLPISADQTIAAFKKLLTDYGLTPEESDGLINAWRTPLFQTNGQRILLRLSAGDYDALCPIGIRPPPTTLVRLGFILTEF